MKARCSNPKSEKYSAYGGRGITVCDRWWESFENFYSDMGARPGDRHSIDRINNDGNYEPSNCRWVDAETQCRNKRSNIMVEYDGRSMCLKDFAKKTGMNYKAIHAKYLRGEKIHAALT